MEYFETIPLYLFFVYIRDNMVEKIKKMRKERYDRAVVLCYDKRESSFSFYGNLKALFDAKEMRQNDGYLGVSYNYIKNLFGREQHYENDNVIIHKDVIITKTNKDWKRNPDYKPNDNEKIEQ